jgi:hypothetical protein
MRPVCTAESPSFLSPATICNLYSTLSRAESPLISTPDYLQNSLSCGRTAFPAARGIDTCNLAYPCLLACIVDLTAAGTVLERPRSFPLATCMPAELSSSTWNVTGTTLNPASRAADHGTSAPCALMNSAKPKSVPKSVLRAHAEKDPGCFPCNAAMLTTVFCASAAATLNTTATERCQRAYEEVRRVATSVLSSSASNVAATAMTHAASASWVTTFCADTSAAPVRGATQAASDIGMVLESVSSPDLGTPSGSYSSYRLDLKRTIDHTFALVGGNALAVPAKGSVASLRGGSKSSATVRSVDRHHACDPFTPELGVGIINREPSPVSLIAQGTEVEDLPGAVLIHAISTATSGGIGSDALRSLMLTVTFSDDYPRTTERAIERGVTPLTYKPAKRTHQAAATSYTTSVWREDAYEGVLPVEAMDAGVCATTMQLPCRTHGIEVSHAHRHGTSFTETRGSTSCGAGCCIALCVLLGYCVVGLLALHASMSTAPSVRRIRNSVSTAITTIVLLASLNGSAAWRAHTSWMRTSKVWRRAAAPAFDPVVQSVQNTSAREIANRFASLFQGFTPAPEPMCIMVPTLKEVDVNGNRILVHPLAYEAIDLAAPVEEATKDVYFNLDEPFGSKLKGPVLAVRGVGGGKTRGMVAFHAKLRSDPSVLPILITFNSNWEVPSMANFRELANTPAKVLALSVISRMASVTFGVEHTEMYRFLVKSKGKLSFLKDRSCRGEALIGAFALYLAERCNATSVVLMVDETMRAVEALRKEFPAHRTDAATYLRRSMLTEDITPFGIKTAVVLSGLEASVSGATDSDKRIASFHLPEELDVEQVVAKLFLKDIDSDGQAHAVAPTLLGNEKPGRQVLSLLARIFHHMPRGLEYVQDELRRRVNRTTTPYTLVFNSSNIRDIWRGAMQRYSGTYHGLYSKGLPGADLLYATLFNKPARMDARVTSGIRTSLFVNSLSATDYPLEGHEPPDIRLRSSLISLHAAVAERGKHQDGSIEECILSIYETVCSWAANITTIARIGSTLEELSVAWMRLLLTVAARAQNDYGASSVTLNDLLQLLRLPADSLSPLVDSYLNGEISLPTGTRAIPVYALEKTCYAVKQNTANKSCPVPGTACLEEMRAKVKLTAERPCAIVVAAPGDCWDYGLIYLGSVSERERVVRTVIFENKAAQVLKLQDKSKLTAGKRRPKTEVRQSINFHQAWGMFQDIAQADRTTQGVPQWIEPLYIYQTTRPGPSTCQEKVIHVGEEDSADYFNVVYPVYEALKAAAESNLSQVVAWAASHKDSPPT